MKILLALALTLFVPPHAPSTAQAPSTLKVAGQTADALIDTAATDGTWAAAIQVAVAQALAGP